MGLYKHHPEPSGRMGLLWTLASVADAAVVEFGAMGHMLYAEKWLQQTGIRRHGRLYTTHINEIDITFGNTDRLREAVEEVIRKAAPKAIFLLPSSIPEIIGVDLELATEELEEAYNHIPIINFKKGGLEAGYHQGIEEALYRLVKMLPVEGEKSKDVTFNIIGSCADLNNFQSDTREIIRLLEGALGLKPVCVLTSDTEVKAIKNMASAHINLVLRGEGLKAAKELKKRFKTPYIYARPYGYEATNQWLKEISEALELSLDTKFLQEELAEGSYGIGYLKQIVRYMPHLGKISLGGNYDVVKGIMDFACREIGMTREYIWCNSKEFATEEIPYWREAQWMTAINRDYKGILMATKTAVERTGGDKRMVIDRGLKSLNINWYSSPFMGFRGAMNLCGLWLEHLL